MSSFFIAHTYNLYIFVGPVHTHQGRCKMDQASSDSPGPLEVGYGPVHFLANFRHLHCTTKLKNYLCW